MAEETDQKLILIDKLLQTIARCFGALAIAEQQAHNSLRANAGEDADRLVLLLEEWLAQLDQELDARSPSGSILTAATSLDAALLDELAAGVTAAEGRIVDPLDSGPIAHMVAIIQSFDDFFELVLRPSPAMTELHDELRERFDRENCIELPGGSRLLRRRSYVLESDFDDRGDPVGLFARYLRNVAFLPAQLHCDDPDAERQPGIPIRSDYQWWISTALAMQELPADPVIAVAPLALRGRDVTFVPSACGSHYALRLNYDKQRLAEALRDALAQRAHILLVPEMALPEENPDSFDDDMAEIIVSVQREHVDRTGDAPEICLIVAGVLGGARADGFHRNYAVMFDADGNRAAGFEQLKLSHWNLKRGEQVLFGIEQHHPGICADPIFENCLPAETFTVLDIPGVGRTGVMICADMAQNNPGDWLSLNAVLDILFAPIMDKSICWEIADSRGSNRPWIVRRSWRTARLARSRVITTNSVALTRWVNEANRLSGKDYPQFKQVGIGLAIDGTRDPPTHSHVLVDVDNPALVTLFEPVDAWKRFPPPPPPKAT